MNLGTIRTLTRTLLSEPTAAYWTDDELNNYINYGQEDFAVRTECIESIDTLSQIQYTADYTLPTTYAKIKQVEIWRGNATYLLWSQDLATQYDGIVKTTGSPPDALNIWANTIRLQQRCANAAFSTTLNGTISASDTSIILTDASSFSRMGRIIIGSEVIQYWNISTNTLSPCTRGVEGTTATSHTTGAIVTQRDIWIYGFKKPATLSTDSDTPEIPSQFHKALAYYAASLGRRKSKDHDLADKYEGEYERAINQGIDWVKTKWKRRIQPK